MVWVLLGLICLCFFLYPILQDLYQIYVQGIPPGPLSLPVIGGVHHLSPKHTHFSLETLGKKYGKIFSVRMGPMGRAVFLQDISLINQMFDDPYTHDRPPLPVFTMVNNGADGIGSCPYDNRWKIMTKMFHRGLAKLSANVIEEKSKPAYSQLISMFSSKSSTAKPYYLRKDTITACSAIMCTLIYGTESEDLDSPELKSRIHYHNMLMSILNPSHPINVIPGLWKLPSPVKRKLLTCIYERDKLFSDNLKSHKEKFTGKIEDIIDVIAEFEEIKDNHDEYKEIRTEDMFLSTWTIYLAACETTTDLTLWIILYMCAYPDIQEKVRREIDAVFPHDSENILKQKHQLPYTRATILECMRLSSPVAIGLPSCANRDIQLGGYTILKGTAIMPCQWHVHHDETHWSNPSELKPERFLDEDGNLYSNHHIFYKMPYIPFSRGKRSCLGQQFALDLLLIFMTTTFKRLIMKLPDGYQPNFTGTFLFNLRAEDFPIQCTER